MRPYRHDNEDGWQRILHRRVSNHVKIYADFELLATKLLVAHRNIVSAYCMVTNKWTQNVQFADYVTSISPTELSIEKRNDKTGPMLYIGCRRMSITLGFS